MQWTKNCLRKDLFEGNKELIFSTRILLCISTQKYSLYVGKIIALAGTIITVDLDSIRKLILFEDTDLLVINKPSGIPVLADGWEKDAPSLVGLLEQQFGKLWVVHRLDKVTSGVMVFALSAAAHRTLSMQFEHHQAQKIYHAILVGVPGWDEHVARHPLRVDVGHNHRTVVVSSHGKTSETAFRVLGRFMGYALIAALPATGRTHQIRVHACALGFPLLGDMLYGAPETQLINRPALHALSLEIIHPATQVRMTFDAPLPDDFQAALEKISLLG